MPCCLSCFKKPSIKVHAVEIECKPITTPLRFLDLPVLMMQKVANYMTPLELIALSLCNDESKEICEHLSRKKNKKTQGTVYINLDKTSMEMRIDFDRWSGISCAFYFEEYKNGSDWKTTILEDVGITKWADSEELNKREPLKVAFEGLIERPKTIMRARQLYSKNPVRAARSWVDHIFGIFNLKVIVLRLNIELTSDNIYSVLNLIHMACPVTQFELITNSQDYFITKILDYQTTTGQLLVWANPSKTFQYDTGRFHLKSTFEADNSSWLRFDQICDMDCGNIALLKSKLVTSDFRQLVNMWRNGWSPIWEIAYFECEKSVDLAGVVEGRSIEIDDDFEINQIDVTNSIKLYKFRSTMTVRHKDIDVKACHIVREDGQIGTFCVSPKKVVLFLIHTIGGERPKILPHPGMQG